MLTYDTKFIVDEIKKLQSDVTEIKRMLEEVLLRSKQISDLQTELAKKADQSVSQTPDVDHLAERIRSLETELQTLRLHIKKTPE